MSFELEYKSVAQVNEDALKLMEIARENIKFKVFTQFFCFVGIVVFKLT